jgi:hypothetical protein
MSSDSMYSGLSGTPNEQIQTKRAWLKAELSRLWIRRIRAAMTAPDYDGGAPNVVMDNEDAAAGIHEDHLPVLLPFGYANVRASGMGVVMEIAPGQFITLGEVGHLPPGKLTTGNCWTVITPGSVDSSAQAVTSRAQRLDCSQDIYVSSVAFVITAGGAGLTARVKLYSADGTLIIDTGDVNCDSAGDKNPPISPAVRITPGTYIVEVTASVGVSWRCADLAPNIAAVMNIGVTQRATSHTMATATTAVSFPVIKFQS